MVKNGTDKNISRLVISCRKSIREAFKVQSLNMEDFLVVLNDDDKVIGVLSDGDFRRAIWNGVPLDQAIETIVNKNFVSVSDEYTVSEVQEIFIKKSEIFHIPVIKNEQLIDVILRADFAFKEVHAPVRKLDIPVVIMAGGEGTRLDPFTKILPKPLIPVGEKPVIEIIIDKFVECGVDHFYISLHHKSKMIKAFFEEVNRNYHISYIEEDRPLGTAGALKFLNNQIATPFIVSNCDIIIEEDYQKIYDFHLKGKYTLTIVGSMQHHVIPYGVCKIHEGGELRELTEKPAYDLLVNTGMYVVNPDVLKIIPVENSFNMTQLIDRLKGAGQRIGVYPISEKSWVDIGQWEEYKKAIEKFQ